jgi:hypothetical protein
MLGKIGAVAVLLGIGLGVWTIVDLGGCADECHSYAVPVVIAAVLVLAGTFALLVAAISGHLRRRLTADDR